MKSGILEVQRRENQADSDPRLHAQVLGRVAVVKILQPTVYKTVYDFSESANRISLVGHQATTTH